ncbi:MAG: hypothetical protein ACM3UV_04405 [Nocardioidaceae bacterium]
MTSLINWRVATGRVDELRALERRALSRVAPLALPSPPADRLAGQAGRGLRRRSPTIG